jgi:hypothetical protein
MPARGLTGQRQGMLQSSLGQSATTHGMESLRVDRVVYLTVPGTMGLGRFRPAKRSDRDLAARPWRPAARILSTARSGLGDLQCGLGLLPE